MTRAQKNGTVQWRMLKELKTLVCSTMFVEDKQKENAQRGPYGILKDKDWG